MDRTEEILRNMCALFERSGGVFELYMANEIRQCIEAGEEAKWDFLISNAIWGGSGSITDQALLDYPKLRNELDLLVIALGREQIRMNKVNVRTASRVNGSIIDYILYWLHIYNWLNFSSLKKLFRIK